LSLLEIEPRSSIASHDTEYRTKQKKKKHHLRVTVQNTLLGTKSREYTRNLLESLASGKHSTERRDEALISASQNLISATPEM
jgi:hypothetical protein